MTTVIVCDINDNYDNIVNAIKSNVRDPNLIWINPKVECSEGFIISDDTKTLSALIYDAIDSSRDDQILLLNGDTKLLSFSDPTSDTKNIIYSFNSYGLLPSLWQEYGECCYSNSFDWTLRITDDYSEHADFSAVASPGAILFYKTWYMESQPDLIFDSLAGIIFDLSFRAWQFGGQVANSGGEIATSNLQISDNDKARLSGLWFSNHQRLLHIGELVPSASFKQSYEIINSKRVHDTDWIINTFASELKKLWSLKNSRPNSRIAIVCPGASVDFVNRFDVYNSDCVIVLDWMFRTFNYDYCLTNLVGCFRDYINDSYDTKKLIASEMLFSGDQRKVAKAASLLPDVITFKLGELGSDLPLISVDPPFFNFGHIIHSAIHFACFLGASDIVLYGLDYNSMGGRSHTKEIHEYNNGFVWPNNNHTLNIYQQLASGLHMMNSFFDENNVRVLRFTCV